MKCLVIMPTYNEKENAPKLISGVLAVNPVLDVLVVDDNSPDGTAVTIGGLMKDLRLPSQNVFLETRPKKLGLGSAYSGGFKWGLDRGYEFLIQMDADWSHHPKYLTEMLSKSTLADFVIGSRYVRGGGTMGWGLFRRLLSRFGSFYARSILGTSIHDFTGGFNGWRAEVLREIGTDTLASDGYSFQIELKFLAAKLGFSHLEFPIIFEERRNGQSKMSPTIVHEAIWRVWWLRFHRFSLGSVRKRETLRNPDLRNF